MTHRDSQRAEPGAPRGKEDIPSSPVRPVPVGSREAGAYAPADRSLLARRPGGAAIAADPTATLPPRAGPRLEDLPETVRPRRVVVLAKRKARTRVTTHWVRALAARGHRVLWLRPGKWRQVLGPAAPALLARRIRAFGPELVFVYKHDAPLALLARLPREIPRVVFYEDAPAEPDPRLLAVAREADLLATTAGGQVPLFEGFGVKRAMHLRTGCDPEDHRPGKPRPEWAADAAFIGGASGEARLALLRAVAGKHRLRVYGSGWAEALGIEATKRDVYPEDYRDICASTRVMLGIDPRSDVPLYFSNRTWLTLGCGGFLLTRYVPRLEELFTNNEHLVWYQEPEEALELLGHYLEHEDERARIARQGCAYVHAHHTFRHAAHELVEALDAGAP